MLYFQTIILISPIPMTSYTFYYGHTAPLQTQGVWFQRGEHVQWKIPNWPPQNEAEESNMYGAV